MPRGRKPKQTLTLDEQITATKDEIGKTKKKLDQLKSTLSLLEKQKEVEATQALVNFIKSTGLSIDELRARLTPQETPVFDQIPPEIIDAENIIEDTPKPHRGRKNRG